MAIYNRGMEKKSEPLREVEKYKKEREPVRQTHRTQEIELPDFVYEPLEKMRTQGEFDHFKDVLRRRYGNNEISKSDFDLYVSIAQKKVSKVLKRSERKEQKESSVSSVDSNISNTYVPSSESKKEEKKSNESEGKLVRGEVEKIPEEKEGKFMSGVSKVKKVLDFLKSPFGRVIFFVLFGLVLLFYLVRSGMSSALNSPIFIIAAILFIILVVGRGGKTKTFDINNI